MVPTGLAEKPELAPDAVPYLHAFYSLDAGRLVGLEGDQALQISEVFAYLQLHGVDDPDERGLFLRHMQLLDAQYLNNKKNKGA